MTLEITIERIVNLLIWPKQNVQNATDLLLLRETILLCTSICGVENVELSTKTQTLTELLVEGRHDRPIWEEASCEVILYDF